MAFLVVDLTLEDDNTANANVPLTSYEFEIPGKPTPLPRNRHHRGGQWNPAKQNSNHFKLAVQKALPATKSGVLFQNAEPVSVTIWFYLQRPLSDFVNGRRAANNLKTCAQVMEYAPIKPDIDNLGKFVLDALSGVVYHDDRQIAKLTMYKLRDNFMECSGRTKVVVTNLHSI